MRYGVNLSRILLQLLELLEGPCFSEKAVRKRVRICNIAIGFIAICSPAAADSHIHADMFEASQKQPLTAMIQSASPADAKCRPREQWRPGFGREIAHCDSETLIAKYRLAVSTEAILLDVDFQKSTPELVGDTLEDLRSHLAKLDDLLTAHGFSQDTLMACVNKAWDSYVQKIRSFGEKQAQSVEIQRGSNFLTCSGSANGLWVYVTQARK
jgi:hypothetical protein